MTPNGSVGNISLIMKMKLTDDQKALFKKLGKKSAKKRKKNAGGQKAFNAKMADLSKIAVQKRRK